MKSRLSATLCLLILTLVHGPAVAQSLQLRGVVQDRVEKKGLSGVQLFNMFDSSAAFTDSNGAFILQASKGQLIEIRYPGYVVERFRISEGHVPPYFKLYLDKIALLDHDKYAGRELTAYQRDSIERYELYKTTLEFPRMSGVDKVASPFSAMSKSNRQKWQFQEEFALREQERYIDFTFNEQLVKQISGLEGEDLVRYMRRYRPGYQKLRSMDTYELYNYIRTTSGYYRRSGKPTFPRNSG